MASFGLGVWLLFSPLVLGGEGTPAANSAHLLGALAASVAAIPLAEVARVVRYLNLAVGALVPGAALLAAPTSFR